LAAKGHAHPVCTAEAPLFDVVDFNRSCEEDRGRFRTLAGRHGRFTDCQRRFRREVPEWARRLIT
jgi:hypothetical protein